MAEEKKRKHERVTESMPCPDDNQLCTLDTDECSRPATVYCDVCTFYMCGQCELSHKNNKFTRKHQALTLTQTTSRRKQPYCPTHTSKLLDIFFEDCNSSICSTCLFKEHKEHKCCALKEKMEDCSGQLDQVLDLPDQSPKVKSEVDKACKVSLVRKDDVNVESDQQLTTVTGQSVKHGDLGARLWKKHLTNKCKEEVSGMVSYHNHLFIVHSCHGKLYVYDEKKMKKSVEILCQKNKRKMENPHGICLVQGEGGTHSLVISDHNGQCLWWLTTEKQAGDVKLGQPYQQQLPYRPYGVSTDRSGRAVVTACYDSQVYVYKPPGQHVTCLQLLGDVKPYQALPDISDGCIVRLSVSFQLIWVLVKRPIATMTSQM